MEAPKPHNQITCTKTYPKPHQKRREGYQNDGIHTEIANCHTCVKLAQICQRQMAIGAATRRGSNSCSDPVGAMAEMVPKTSQNAVLQA